MRSILDGEDALLVMREVGRASIVQTGKRRQGRAFFSPGLLGNWSPLNICRSLRSKMAAKVAGSESSLT